MKSRFVVVVLLAPLTPACIVALKLVVSSYILMAARMGLGASSRPRGYIFWLRPISGLAFLDYYLRSLLVLSKRHLRVWGWVCWRKMSAKSKAINFISYFYIIGTSISSFICSIKDSIVFTLPIVSATLSACSLSFRSWQGSCPDPPEELPEVIGAGSAVEVGLVLFPSAVVG